jgi:hypothetical protein
MLICYISFFTFFGSAMGVMWVDNMNMTISGTSYHCHLSSVKLKK